MLKYNGGTKLAFAVASKKLHEATMKKFRVLTVAAAALAASLGAARADVYSYTAAMSGGWDDSGGEVTMSPIMFNRNLGILRGVTYHISGIASVADYDDLGVELPNNSPLAVIMQVTARLFLYGFYGDKHVGYAADAGSFPANGTYNEVSGSGAIDVSFKVPHRFVAGYADPSNTNPIGGLGQGIAFMAFAYAPGSGLPLRFDGQLGTFTGSYTETFYYSPTHRHPVPEPTSFAILGTGVLMLAGGLRRRRSRQG